MFKLLVNIFILNVFIPVFRVNAQNIDEATDEDRAPLEFFFFVLLYNSQDPNRTCTGAIITKWFVLDNCEDFPGYEYEYMKGGWTKDKIELSVYKIEYRIHHENYKRVDLKSKDFDTDLLFAGENVLFLHKSATEMYKAEKVKPIKFNTLSKSPKKGHVVYIYNGTITTKSVKFIKSNHCNEHFKSYFDPGKQMLLNGESTICTDTAAAGINQEHCCNSQAFLVADRILTGIMAWSTGCSKEFGVDPWVFTNIGYYFEWIFLHSDAEEYIASVKKQ